MEEMVMVRRSNQFHRRQLLPADEAQLDHTTAKLRADLKHAAAPVVSAKTAKIIQTRNFQLRLRIAAVCILAPITLWLELTVQLYGILLLGCLVGAIAITFVVIDEIISTVGRWRKKRQ
jgi:hypothetical protein